MKKFIVFPILCLLCVGSFSFAQGAKTKADSNELSKAEKKSDENLSDLSVEDIDGKSAESIDGMRATLTSTQELLQKARDEKEGILTLNCINQKMAAMKGFVKVSEQQSATIAKNPDRKVREQSFRLISISSDRVEALYEDALNCTGESSRYASETKVNRITPDIADVEVIEIDDDLFDDTYAKERLPELTPYQ